MTRDDMLESAQGNLLTADVDALVNTVNTVGIMGKGRAATFLADKPETMARLDRVTSLIEGFETPFGMELLGTVHWTMRSGKAASTSVESVIDAVQSWSERKRSTMREGHIHAAWTRLVEQNWIDVPAQAASTAGELPPFAVVDSRGISVPVGGVC